MSYNLQELVKQWDRLSDTAVENGQNYAEVDALQWFNYLAFDIIGDLVRSHDLQPSTLRYITKARFHNMGPGAGDVSFHSTVPEKSSERWIDARFAALPVRSNKKGP